MRIVKATALAAVASIGIHTTVRAQDYVSCPDADLGFQKYKNLLAECMADSGHKLSAKRLEGLLQDEVEFDFGVMVETPEALEEAGNLSQSSVVQEGSKYQDITRLVAAQPNRIYGIHKSLSDNIERIQLENLPLPAQYEALKSQMLGSFAQTLPLVGEVASSEKTKSDGETIEPQESQPIEPSSDITAAGPSGINVYGIVGGLAAVAAAGGGGGGGGGGGNGGGGGGGGNSGGLLDGQYRNTADGLFETEFNFQQMLGSINALSLNNYGYSGEGVRVAVVDSGIDSTHPEFDGKTINGHDFANSLSGYGADENGHGSHVASIIGGERDGSGMRGFAYDSTLYDYKVDNDGDDGLDALNTDSEIAAVFNRHVADNIHVSNNSWGSGSPVTLDTEAAVRAIYPDTITAIRAAQANGTLIVFSAGNDGFPNPDSSGGLPYVIPELANEWLVVVAVDTNLTETEYTNRCGVAVDFCVTAPGGGDDTSADGILAARANGTLGDEYVRYSGTSMAAPHVSGLAAALMEKFPSLTPAQIATRINQQLAIAV